MTLYEQLGMPAQAPGVDRGRTERTATLETIDRDRMVVDLYAALGGQIGDDTGHGRTEITREAPETVDKDRAVEALTSSLTGPPTDLYGALVRPSRTVLADRGETVLTASTETIDYDQPPELSYG
jgi:hypothetical protein